MDTINTNSKQAKKATGSSSKRKSHLATSIKVKRQKYDRENFTEHYTLPLECGWKREIVVRSVVQPSKSGEAYCKLADVYYYPPIGKKLRSMREVDTYLQMKHPFCSSELTRSNFTFLSEKLFDHPNEWIRNAKETKKQKKNITKKKTPHHDIRSKKLKLPKTKPSGPTTPIAPQPCSSSSSTSSLPPKISSPSISSTVPPRMCNLSCPGLEGIPPRLECRRCLCLSHAECLGGDDMFLCKICRGVERPIKTARSPARKSQATKKHSDLRCKSYTIIITTTSSTSSSAATVASAAAAIPARTTVSASTALVPAALAPMPCNTIPNVTYLNHSNQANLSFGIPPMRYTTGFPTHSPYVVLPQTPVLYPQTASLMSQNMLSTAMTGQQLLGTNYAINNTGSLLQNICFQTGPANMGQNMTYQPLTQLCQTFTLATQSTQFRFSSSNPVIIDPSPVADMTAPLHRQTHGGLFGSIAARVETKTLQVVQQVATHQMATHQMAKNKKVSSSKTDNKSLGASAIKSSSSKPTAQRTNETQTNSSRKDSYKTIPLSDLALPSPVPRPVFIHDSSLGVHESTVSSNGVTSKIILPSFEEILTVGIDRAATHSDDKSSLPSVSLPRIECKSADLSSSDACLGDADVDASFVSSSSSSSSSCLIDCNMSCLSNQLLRKIFHWLSTSDLISASQVCKAWNLVSQSQELWETVEISKDVLDSNRRLICLDEMLRVQQAHALDLRRLDLTNVKSFHRGFLPLLRNLSGISTLHAGQCSADVVRKVNEFLPGLLQLTLTEGIGRDSSLVESLADLKCLRKLEVKEVGMKSDRSEDDRPIESSWKGEIEDGIPQFLQLETLKLLGAPAQSPLHFRTLLLSSGFQKLTSLQVSSCINWNKQMYSLLAGLTTLTSLDIGFGGSIPDLGLSHALVKMTRLVDLKLRRYVVDWSVSLSIQKLHQLRKLLLHPSVPAELCGKVSYVNLCCMYAVWNLKNLGELTWVATPRLSIEGSPGLLPFLVCDVSKLKGKRTPKPSEEELIFEDKCLFLSVDDLLSKLQTTLPNTRVKIITS